MPRGVSLLDEARIQGRLWTPAEFKPSIWVWIQGRLWTPAEFKPSIWVSTLNLNTVASATGVSSLANMGTAGGSFVQATAANQALFRRADGDRGPAFPYLDFDGTNDSLSLSAAAGTAINRFMYLFAVCRPGPNTAAFKSTIYGSNDGSLWVGRNSSQWRHAGSGSVADTAYANGRQVGTLTFTAFSAGVAYNMPDSWGVYSRSLVAVSGAGIDFGRNPTHLARGDSSAGATTAATKLAEFLAIPFDIGLAGLRKVEGYLSWLHRLPLVAEHPFASRPPLIGD